MSVYNGAPISTKGLRYYIDGKNKKSAWGPDIGDRNYYVANQEVTVTTSPSGIITVVSNQSGSTPGLWPMGGTGITVPTNTRCLFRVKAKQSIGTTAYAYVWGNTNGNLVWTGQQISTGSDFVWIDTYFNTGTNTEIRPGVLWSGVAVGATFQVEDFSLHMLNKSHNLYDSAYSAEYENSTDLYNETDSVFEFDGADDYLMNKDIGAFSSGEFTVSVWFKASTMASYDNILDCNYTGSGGNVGPRLEMQTGGRLTWLYGSDYNTNSTYTYYRMFESGDNAWEINKWYQTVITREGDGTTKLYWQGEDITGNMSEVGSFIGGETQPSLTNTWVNDMQAMIVGKGFVADPNRYFHGQIGSVAVYDRTLSSTEIKQAFNANKRVYGVE